MPRNLEQLRKQYNSSNAKGPEKRPGGGPRGGPGAMRGASGKPKDAKKTLSVLNKAFEKTPTYEPTFASRPLRLSASCGATVAVSLFITGASI